ncbi:hypothetical protein MPSEU_000459600 [Mayamaea pseudoterrestris]|nr:hypothetical protein MPSEU_000459600 [Mayamaea pseudoterrestris]
MRLNSFKSRWKVWSLLALSFLWRFEVSFVCFTDALGTLTKAPDDSIRIVSWNILADTYAKPEKYPETLARDLDWSIRSDRILDRIAAFDADIVCLQEVQLSHWPSFALNCSNLGYNCELLQNVTRKHPVAMAILYRPQTAQVLAVESRSRALLAALRLSQSQEILFLANVHFQAGRNGQAEEQRYFQIRSLLRRIQVQATHHLQSLFLTDTEPSIVLMGDFNMNRTSNIYHLLSKGNNAFDQPGVDCFKESKQKQQQLPYLPLIDVHRTAMDSLTDSYYLQPPTFRTGCILDYIFTSESVETVPWQPDAIHASEMRLSPTGRERLLRQNRCYAWPSATHPSDHMPIGVEIRVKKQ